MNDNRLTELREACDLAWLVGKIALKMLAGLLFWLLAAAALLWALGVW